MIESMNFMSSIFFAASIFWKPSELCTSRKSKEIFSFFFLLSLCIVNAFDIVIEKRKAHNTNRLEEVFIKFPCVNVD